MNAGLLAGYKRTEVGLIPEDWSIVELGNLAEFITSGSRGWARYYADCGALFIRSQNVRDGQLDLVDSQLVTPPQGSEGSRTRVKHSDLLITITGNSVGNVALVEQDLGEAYISQHVGLVRLREPLRGQYVCRYLSSGSPGNSQISASQSGQSKPGLTLRDLQDFLVALPPSPEQRAIAAALGDVDALLGGLDRLIAKKRDIKQAAMQQLLTGKTRLPGFNGEWGVKAIHEISQVGRGRVISHMEISKSSTPTYPVFSSQTSNSGIMGYLDTHDFEGDYVTWTTDGANAGTVFARSGRFNCTNVCGTIKLHDSDHRFIAAALGRVSQPHVSRHLGNPKLMNDVMKKIEIAIPRTRAEQTAIATVLSDMDAELAALEARRDKTRNLKQAMMQELLTGRTRLVEPASNVIPVDFSAKPKSAAGQPPVAKAHNWAINEAVVVAVLVKQFGSEQYPLGRKRCTKLSYLMHRHVEHVAQGYLKKAAGPYNPSVKYKGPEGIAQKNGYIRAQSQGKFSGFVAAEKVAQADGYFEKWYGPDVLIWLEQFRFKSNDELELLATVDMAVEDLRRAGRPASVDAVKSVIHDNPEWEAKLEREIFSDANIARAIAQTRELFQ